MSFRDDEILPDVQGVILSDTIDADEDFRLVYEVPHLKPTWQDILLNYSTGVFVAVGIGCGLLLIVLVTVCSICWHYRKLKRREEDKLLQSAAKMEEAEKKKDRSEHYVRRLEPAEHTDTEGLETTSLASTTTEEATYQNRMYEAPGASRYSVYGKHSEGGLLQQDYGSPSFEPPSPLSFQAPARMAFSQPSPSAHYAQHPAPRRYAEESLRPPEQHSSSHDRLSSVVEQHTGPPSSLQLELPAAPLPPSPPPTPQTQLPPCTSVGFHDPPDSSGVPSTTDTQKTSPAQMPWTPTKTSPQSSVQRLSQKTPSSSTSSHSLPPPEPHKPSVDYLKSLSPISIFRPSESSPFSVTFHPEHCTPNTDPDSTNAPDSSVDPQLPQTCEHKTAPLPPPLFITFHPKDHKRKIEPGDSQQGLSESVSAYQKEVSHVLPPTASASVSSRESEDQRPSSYGIGEPFGLQDLENPSHVTKGPFATQGVEGLDPRASDITQDVEPSRFIPQSTFAKRVSNNPRASHASGDLIHEKEPGLDPQSSFDSRNTADPHLAPENKKDPRSSPQVYFSVQAPLEPGQSENPSPQASIAPQSGTSHTGERGWTDAPRDNTYNDQPPSCSYEVSMGGLQQFSVRSGPPMDDQQGNSIENIISKSTSNTKHENWQANHWNKKEEQNDMTSVRYFENNISQAGASEYTDNSTWHNMSPRTSMVSQTEYDHLTEIQTHRRFSDSLAVNAQDSSDDSSVKTTKRYSNVGVQIPVSDPLTEHIEQTALRLTEKTDQVFSEKDVEENVCTETELKYTPQENNRAYVQQQLVDQTQSDSQMRALEHQHPDHLPFAKDRTEERDPKHPSIPGNNSANALPRKRPRLGKEHLEQNVFNNTYSHKPVHHYPFCPPADDASSNSEAASSTGKAASLSPYFYSHEGRLAKAHRIYGYRSGFDNKQPVLRRPHYPHCPCGTPSPPCKKGVESTPDRVQDNAEWDYRRPLERKVSGLRRTYSNQSRLRFKLPSHAYSYYPYSPSRSPPYNTHEQERQTDSSQYSPEWHYRSEGKTIALRKAFSQLANTSCKVSSPYYPCSRSSSSPPRIDDVKSESISTESEKDCRHGIKHTVSGLRRVFSNESRKHRKLPLPGPPFCPRSPSQSPPRKKQMDDTVDDSLNCSDWDYRNPVERKVSGLRRTFSDQAKNCQKLPMPEYPHYPCRASSPRPSRKKQAESTMDSAPVESQWGDNHPPEGKVADLRRTFSNRAKNFKKLPFPEYPHYPCSSSPPQTQRRDPKSVQMLSDSGWDTRLHQEVSRGRRYSNSSGNEQMPFPERPQYPSSSSPSPPRKKSEQTRTYSTVSECKCGCDNPPVGKVSQLRRVYSNRSRNVVKLPYPEYPHYPCPSSPTPPLKKPTKTSPVYPCSHPPSPPGNKHTETKVVTSDFDSDDDKRPQNTVSRLKKTFSDLSKNSKRLPFPEYPFYPCPHSPSSCRCKGKSRDHRSRPRSACRNINCPCPQQSMCHCHYCTQPSGASPGTAQTDNTKHHYPFCAPVNDSSPRAIQRDNQTQPVYRYPYYPPLEGSPPAAQRSNQQQPAHHYLYSPSPQSSQSAKNDEKQPVHHYPYCPPPPGSPKAAQTDNQTNPVHRYPYYPPLEASPPAAQRYNQKQPVHHYPYCPPPRCSPNAGQKDEQNQPVDRYPYYPPLEGSPPAAQRIKQKQPTHHYPYSPSPQSSQSEQKNAQKQPVHHYPYLASPSSHKVSPRDNQIQTVYRYPYYPPLEASPPAAQRNNQKQPVHHYPYCPPSPVSPKAAQRDNQNQPVHHYPYYPPLEGSPPAAQRNNQKQPVHHYPYCPPSPVSPKAAQRDNQNQPVHHYPYYPPLEGSPPAAQRNNQIQSAHRLHSPYSTSSSSQSAPQNNQKQPVHHYPYVPPSHRSTDRANQKRPVHRYPYYPPLEASPPTTQRDWQKPVHHYPYCPPLRGSSRAAQDNRDQKVHRYPYCPCNRDFTLRAAQDESQWQTADVYRLCSCTKSAFSDRSHYVLSKGESFADESRVSKALKKFGQRAQVYSKLPFPKYPYYPCTPPNSPPITKGTQELCDSSQPDSERDFSCPPEGIVSALRTHFMNRSRSSGRKPFSKYHKRSRVPTPFSLPYSRKGSVCAPGPNVSQDSMHEKQGLSKVDKLFRAKEVAPSQDMVTFLRNEFMQKRAKLSGGMAPWPVEASHLAREFSHDGETSRNQSDLQVTKKRTSLTEKLSDSHFRKASLGLPAEASRHSRKLSNEQEMDTRQSFIDTVNPVTPPSSRRGSQDPVFGATADFSRKQSNDMQPDISHHKSNDGRTFVSRMDTYLKQPDHSRRSSTEESNVLKTRSHGEDEKTTVSSRRGSKDPVVASTADFSRKQSGDRQPDISHNKSNDGKTFVSRMDIYLKQPDYSRRSSKEESNALKTRSHGKDEKTTVFSRRGSQDPAFAATADFSRKQSSDIQPDISHHKSNDGKTFVSRKDIYLKQPDHSRRSSKEKSNVLKTRSHVEDEITASSRRGSQDPVVASTADFSRKQSGDMQPDISHHKSNDGRTFVSKKYIYLKQPDYSRRSSKEESNVLKTRSHLQDEKTTVSSRRGSQGPVVASTADFSRKQSSDMQPDISHHKSNDGRTFVSRKYIYLKQPDHSRRSSKEESNVLKTRSHGEDEMKITVSSRRGSQDPVVASTADFSRNQSSDMQPDISHHKSNDERTFVSRKVIYLKQPDHSRRSSKEESNVLKTRSHGEDEMKITVSSRKGSQDPAFAATGDFSRNQSSDMQADLSYHNSNVRRPFVSRKDIYLKQPDHSRHCSKEESNLYKTRPRGDENTFARKHSRGGEVGVTHQRSDTGETTFSRWNSWEGKPDASRRNSGEDPDFHRGHSGAREPESTRRHSNEVQIVVPTHSNQELGICWRQSNGEHTDPRRHSYEREHDDVRRYSNGGNSELSRRISEEQDVARNYSTDEGAKCRRSSSERKQKQSTERGPLHRRRSNEREHGSYRRHSAEREVIPRRRSCVGEQGRRPSGARVMDLTQKYLKTFHENTQKEDR